MQNITSLGELKASGYEPKTIKDEIRFNLIEKLRKKETIFKGVLGFEETVIPDMERAMLSRHNMLLLGLRGQAKTKLARMMVGLLDEFVPVVKGSELNDDPLNPISRFAIDLIAKNGDDTEVAWLHRDERYVEKLATPDVSIADLVGDVDPIKAATLKLPYSDERVIHFGLIPRAHRCIFVINELPDLQARIQVSLFNILQEGDMQIRGFKLRLPLEVQFLFTANPEDYTNRGSIITPLKDRIESQILTHYPRTIEIAKTITQQEARLSKDQVDCIALPELAKNILEEVAFNARESEFIDDKSGVSARLSISGYENLVSTAERRMILNKEKSTTIRIGDFLGIIPAITGKVELVYEGEQEGPVNVALSLFKKTFKDIFLECFPDPNTIKKGINKDPYGAIKLWFSGGNVLDLPIDSSDKDYQIQLKSVAGLERLIDGTDGIDKKDRFLMMELVLHGLCAMEVLNQELLDSGFSFNDLLADMFDDLKDN